MSSKLQTNGTLDGGTLRRALLLVAVVALVATAGCLGGMSDDPDDGASPSGDPIDSVPANQDALLHVDMAVLQDQAVMNVSNAMMGTSTGQADVEGALDEIENETGLDVRSVDELLLYGTSQDLSTDVSEVQDEQFGVVIHSSWSEDELVSAINEDSEDGELVATSYQGQEVLYEPTGGLTDGEQSAYLGVLGDGAFVFGTEQPVKGALDVEYDGASNVSGPVRDAYDDAREGYVTVATQVPEEQTDQVGQDEIGENLSAMSAVAYTNEGQDEIGAEAQLSFASESSAVTLHDELQTQLDDFAREEPMASTVLDSLDLERDGSSVVLTFQDEAQTIAAYLQLLVGGQGTGQF